jgi:hypothetical protein
MAQERNQRQDSIVTNTISCLQQQRSSKQ